MNIKSGDTVTYEGLSATVISSPYPLTNGDSITTIYNKWDGELDVLTSQLSTNDT